MGVTECFQTEGALATCATAGSYGIPPAFSGRTSGVLEEIQVGANGVITGIPNAVKGIQTSETCVLTPSVGAGSILAWQFSGACVTAGYVKQ
ncbi:hypothetical protein D3C84_1161190 [compost metagenome]